MKLDIKLALGKAWNDLQSLDVQNPGAWPTWVRIAASILLALIIIGGGLWFLVKPLREELAAAEAQEVDLRGEFERKQKKVAALDAYKDQLKEMERSFGAMLRQLPSRTEVANLLADISQTRVASALEEELFQPQPEMPKDFYAEIPNRIIVTGGYHEMGAFVSAVAALPRIVTIDEVELKPAGGTAPRGELRMTALAKTYRYLEEGEITPPAGAKK
ncbi:MAG: pilus assembly protein PilO [Hydrocarboniphaga sp.]|uniref:type 4a pilus biogenesis protein PilO n=1 Tax=Hydrocarboniphaga sp. TaxID=2033016 RepID=UPI002638F870|nr:type 4a pilus biogenesis protein PilO [Hydrocarboniphaga sp.]MDB5972015.1 pilus assembly protein PilO [Hydrocarboniphaga sp.]